MAFTARKSKLVDFGNAKSWAKLGFTIAIFFTVNGHKSFSLGLPQRKVGGTADWIWNLFAKLADTARQEKGTRR